MEIRKALLDTLLAGAANVHAAMPVRPFPRPARRARAVSAAIGRFHHPPSTEVHSKRPLQLVPLLQSSRWRLTRATPQHLDQPHHPHQPPAQCSTLTSMAVGGGSAASLHELPSSLGSVR